MIFVEYRLRIVKRAKELNVRLTNAQAKAKKESTEWALLAISMAFFQLLFQLMRTIYMVWL